MGCGKLCWWVAQASHVVVLPLFRSVRSVALGIVSYSIVSWHTILKLDDSNHHCSSIFPSEKAQTWIFPLCFTAQSEVFKSLLSFMELTFSSDQIKGYQLKTSFHLSADRNLQCVCVLSGSAPLITAADGTASPRLFGHGQPYLLRTPDIFSLLPAGYTPLVHYLKCSCLCCLLTADRA